MKGLVACLNYREFEVINLAAQPPGRLAVSLTATTDNEPWTTDHDQFAAQRPSRQAPSSIETFAQPAERCHLKKGEQRGVTTKNPTKEDMNLKSW